IELADDARPNALRREPLHESRTYRCILPGQEHRSTVEGVREVRSEFSREGWRCQERDAARSKKMAKCAHLQWRGHRCIRDHDVEAPHREFRKQVFEPPFAADDAHWVGEP